MIKRIDIYAWELIPSNERHLHNPDFDYIVRAEMSGGGLMNYTYKIEGNDIYIGRWYRAKENTIVWTEIGLADWQRLSSDYKKVTYDKGFKFYKGVLSDN